MFSLSIAFSLIEFLLDRVAVVTVITPVGRDIKTNLAASRPMRRNSIMVKGNWRERSLFYRTRQTSPAAAISEGEFAAGLNSAWR
jgi:hypothetical protein